MRIVSLVPSITETLFELGLDDEIVAVTRWCNRPAEKVVRKPKVGGTKNPNLDSVIEFKPDIVILDCDENRKEDADELESRGVRTFSVFPKTVEDSIQIIRDLGELFPVQLKAKQMIDEIQQLRENYRPAPIPDTLILIWRAPYMTFNADTYAHAACSLFGFQNLFAKHEQRYPTVTAKEIEQAHPAVVLFPDEPYPFRAKHLEQFKTEFSHVPVSRNNRMLLFDGAYIAWHGYGTLRALREFPSVISSQLL